MCYNECPRKEWRGGREKRRTRSKARRVQLTNLKTLKNQGRKERKGTRDVQASSRPQKRAGDGGEHGYKGGRYVGWRGLGGMEQALDMIPIQLKPENHRGQAWSRLAHVLRSVATSTFVPMLATDDEQPHARTDTSWQDLRCPSQLCPLVRSHSWRLLLCNLRVSHNLMLGAPFPTDAKSCYLRAQSCAIKRWRKRRYRQQELRQIDECGW
jgi:hypothetical protein